MGAMNVMEKKYLKLNDQCVNRFLVSKLNDIQRKKCNSLKKK